MAQGRGTYIRSEETRNKNREAAQKQVYQTGWHHSEETRERIGTAHTGKCHTEEHKRKIGEKSKGHIVSEEVRLRISKTKTGIKRAPYSEKWRENISTALRNRAPPSEETRNKLRMASTGRKLSDEAVERIRLSKLELFKDSKNHPMWKGGISFEPYCEKFKPEFKERVREFFGRVCVECGVAENGRRLDVHHVNFDKSSCCSDVKPLFVALCRTCHMRTNYDREYWEERYTKMIMTRFNGQCYLPKVI